MHCYRGFTIYWMTSLRGHVYTTKPEQRNCLFCTGGEIKNCGLCELSGRVVNNPFVCLKYEEESG